MNQPCPNCGNRQHAPDATVCRVCGQPLNSARGNLYKKSLPGNNPPRQIGRSDQNLPVQFNPCLMDEQGRQYAISPEGDTWVGSVSSADVCIRGPNIQHRHARIYLSGDQMLLEAMIGCLVLVNGRATGRQAYRLRDRDIITFGSGFMMQYQSNGATRQTRAIDTPSIDYTDMVISPTTQPQRRTSSPPQNCDLYGRVRHVDGPHMEDPDPSLGRALAKVTGFALALWKPAFLLFQRPNQQTPVRFLRIETTVGDIRMVKMKGNLVTGTLHTGDFVLFWGEWQNGTLLMHRGYNETAHADIRLRQ